MNFLDIFGSIADAIGTVAGTIGNYINLVLPIIWGDLQALADALKNAVSALWSALSSIWSWVKLAWDWLHNHVIAPIQDWIQNVTEWFSEWITPLKQWIDQWIQLYRWYWQNIIKPGLDFIQRIRQFLLIFRLAGFKWAAELDAYLQGVEFKVEGAFLAVWQNLNMLADWINFLVDPFGNIQGAVLLGSISPIAGAIYATLWGLQNGSLDPGTAAWSANIFSQFSDAAVQQKTQSELTIGPDANDTAAVLLYNQWHAAIAAGQNPLDTGL
jgi:hypothetical protein